MHFQHRHPSRAIFLSLALALTLAIGWPTGPARAAVFSPETFTLDNGMQVVVITNRIAPVVTHMVWYKAGAADEQPGLSGIAHFLEHLLFRGTETYGDGVFSETVRRNGGNDNAFTSYDYTAYVQNIAVESLPLVMAMEADRMVNLKLNEELIEVERGVILEERRQRIGSSPARRLAEQMVAAFYRNHPYGTPIIGWEHEIESLPLAEIQAFYDRWYAPNNAILVVSGDIDAETLRPLAEETYGAIPAAEPIVRVRPSEPPERAEQRITLRDPSVQQPSWRRYYEAPSYRLDPDGMAYAAQLLSQILGAGDVSRLYRSLVVNQQLVIGAGTGYSPQSLDGATFSVYVSPGPDPDWPAIEAALQTEFDRLITEGVSEEELAAAKKRLTIQAIYARDSLGGPARTLGGALATGQTVEDVEQWPERIGAVTAEQVVEAAREILRVERSITGLLLPALERGS